MRQTCRQSLRAVSAAAAIGIALLGPNPATAESIPVGSKLAFSLMGWGYCDVDNATAGSDFEHGLANVEILLEGLTDEEQPIYQTVLTAKDGSFRFDGLAPGTYSLWETQPERYVQGKPHDPIMAPGVADGPDRFKDIVLAADVEPTGYYLFGEWGLKAAYITKKPFIVRIPEPGSLTLALVGLPVAAAMVASRFARGR